MHSSFCVCNLTDHAVMNQKWNDLRCLPQMVDKPIEPRPQKVSPCVQSCSYQAPQKVSTVQQQPINDQLKELKDVESQLHGRQRHAFHNYVPYAGSRIKPNSSVWNQHNVSNNVHPSSSVVQLRLPTSPINTSCVLQPKTTTSNSFSNFTENDSTNTCVRGPYTSQNESPWKMNKPYCAPMTFDAQTPSLWNGQMPCYHTEPWTWNDHPYMIDTGFGVRENRVNNRSICTSPIQDMFMNNTRRKQNIL